MNRTANPGRLPASETALEIHRRGPVVDLLVGSALFRDEFVRPAGRGHVDLPRLRAAGVSVVGLTIATRFPDLRGTLSGIHFRSLGAPEAAMRSNMALAEWLIGRIEGWCEESGGQMALVRTRRDLERNMRPGGPVGVVLVVQGGHVLDGELANVGRLRELGVRVFGPAHVMDNDVVGSGTGRHATGLTSFGHELVRELEAQSIVIDLAHMSARGIDETLAETRKAVAVTHTGVSDVAASTSRWRRYSPATRNLPASLLAEVGRRGGLVGVVLSTQLLGGDNLGAAVRTVRVALEAAGPSAVAIGSDMDGALRTVIDAEGLPALTSALLEAGLDPAVVEGVVGRNAGDFLRRALPG